MARYLSKSERLERETLAKALAEEDDLLRRRIVRATRPKRPLTLDEARELSEREADAHKQR